MKKVLVLVLILVALGLLNCDNPTGSNSDQQEHRIDWPSLCDSPWPIWGGDPQHTYRSPYAGPSKCDTTLIYRNISGFFHTGPLIGPDDEIYIFSSLDETYLGAAGYKGAVVKKLTAKGTVVWQTLVSTKATTISTEPILTSLKNLIITCDDGTMTNVQADGTNKYFYANQVGPGASWGLNLDKDGNIYLLPDNDRFSSYNLAGLLRWQKIYIGKECYDGSISTDGRQIYTGLEDTLLALNTDGEILWKYTGGYGFLTSVNNAGDILSFSNADSSIICLNSNGKLKWKKQIVIGDIVLNDIFNNIAIGPEGEVIAFLRTVGYKYAVSIDRDGELKWIFPLTSIGPSVSITSWSIIDKNGNIYCSDNGTVFSLNSSGSLRWMIKIWDANLGGCDDWLAINSKGEIIYCISRLYGNLVYKIG